MDEKSQFFPFKNSCQFFPVFEKLTQNIPFWVVPLAYFLQILIIIHFSA